MRACNGTQVEAFIGGGRGVVSTPVLFPGKNPKRVGATIAAAAPAAAAAAAAAGAGAAGAGLTLESASAEAMGCGWAQYP